MKCAFCTERRIATVDVCDACYCQMVKVSAGHEPPRWYFAALAAIAMGVIMLVIVSFL